MNGDCRRNLLKIFWLVERTNHFILDEVKPNSSLDVLITKSMLKSLGHNI